MNYDAEVGYVHLAQLLADTPGALLELRALPSKDRIWISEPGQEVDKVNSWLQRRQNVYVGVAHRSERGGAKEDLTGTCSLHADLDFKEMAGGIEEAIAKLRAYPRPPSFVLHSGGGLHAYWRINHNLLTEEAHRRHCDAILKQLAEDLGADRKAAECARVLRLAGTYNFKQEYGKPRPVVFYPDLDLANAPYRIEDFPLPEPVERKPQERRPVPRSGHGDTIPDRILSMAVDRAARDGRNNSAFWLAQQMNDNRFSQMEAEALAMTFRGCVDSGDHPFTQQEALHAVEMAYNLSQREPWADYGFNLKPYREMVGSALIVQEEPAEKPASDPVPLPPPAPEEDAVYPYEAPPEDPDQYTDPESVPPVTEELQRSTPKDDHAGLVDTLAAEVARVERRIRKLGAKTDRYGLILPPGIDREDLEKIGIELKFGTERVKVVLSFLWGDWYNGLPHTRGARQSILYRIYKSDLKAQNEQKRLADLAMIARAIPREQRDMGRSWSFYERLARVKPARREYWLTQTGKGLIARMDAEIMEAREASLPQSHPEPTEVSEIPRPSAATFSPHMVIHSEPNVQLRLNNFLDEPKKDDAVIWQPADEAIRPTEVTLTSREAELIAQARAAGLSLESLIEAALKQIKADLKNDLDAPETSEISEGLTMVNPTDFEIETEAEEEEIPEAETYFEPYLSGQKMCRQCGIRPQRGHGLELCHTCAEAFRELISSHTARRE